MLLLNIALIILAAIKAFWLWRIWCLVRHVRPGPAVQGAARDQSVTSAEVTTGDQLVTTFQVIRKVHR